jgi:hypothetical protein
MMMSLEVMVDAGLPSWARKRMPSSGISKKRRAWLELPSCMGKLSTGRHIYII